MNSYSANSTSSLIPQVHNNGFPLASTDIKTTWCFAPALRNKSPRNTRRPTNYVGHNHVPVNSSLNAVTRDGLITSIVQQ